MISLGIARHVEEDYLKQKREGTMNKFIASMLASNRGWISGRFPRRAGPLGLRSPRRPGVACDMKNPIGYWVHLAQAGPGEAGGVHQEL